MIKARLRIVSLLAPTLALAVLLWLPRILSSYSSFVLALIMVNIIAVIGLNIVMGYAGLVSLGHAGFVGLGAYGTTLLMTHMGTGYIPSMFIVAVGAFIVGIVVGLPALRLGPIYLVMTTYAFGQAVTVILVNWIDVTRGYNGLKVPVPTILGMEIGTRDFYYVVVIVFAGLALLAWRLIHSSSGRALVAMRDSEAAAQAIGINLAIGKTMAFAISAVFGAIAGSLYAGLTQFINPDGFRFANSLLYLNMAVVGGMGTMLGPVIGGSVLTLLPEAIRGFEEYRGVFSGAILLTFLVFMPTGIVGAVRRLLGRRPAWLAGRRPIRERDLEVPHDS